MAQDEVATIEVSHFKDWPNDAAFNELRHQPEPVEIPIQGIIPAQVAGTLYRTGPGMFKPEGTDFEVDHWFDGFTTVHRFQLVPQADGTCKAFYNCRRVDDDLIEKARKSGTMENITFGQKRDPCESLFQKAKSVFKPRGLDLSDPGSVNVGVTVHANSPAAPEKLAKEGDVQIKSLTLLTDACMAKHIDPETLEPIGVTAQTILHPDLKGPLSAAHAQWDPVTGDCFNYNLDFRRNAVYRVFRTSAKTGKTDILATITGSQVKPAYIHSFFLTEDYVILCLFPAVIGAGGARILWERNILDAYKFDRNLQARWCVVDRRHGRGLVATYLSPAFFAFHTCNAWQEDKGESEDLICDVIQYPDDTIVRGLYYENMISSSKKAKTIYGEKNSRPGLVRYRLASVPKTGKQKNLADAQLPKAEELLNLNKDAVGDLPTINPLFSTQKTRYVYSAISRGLSSFYDGVGKVDTETGETKIWGEDKQTPGEPIFVPSGTNESEDAGYLLTVVLNGGKGTSSLVCLNARDLTEVGRANCPIAVGFGFHGEHIPSRL